MEKEKLTKEAEDSLLHQYFFNKGKEIGRGKKRKGLHLK